MTHCEERNGQKEKLPEVIRKREENGNEKSLKALALRIKMFFFIFTFF